MSLTASISMDHDRRRHQRAQLAPTLRQYTAGTDLAAHVLDVSEGGARLAVSDPDRLKNSMELWVPLLDREGQLTTCHIEGEVVRREGEEIGVKFSHLLPLHFLQLRDFVWRSQTSPAPLETAPEMDGGSRFKQFINRLF